jgi:hypothetical protein
MSILLIILGIVAYLVNLNGLLVIPKLIYVGLIVVGCVLLAINIIGYLSASRKIRRGARDMFDRFDRF